MGKGIKEVWSHNSGFDLGNEGLRLPVRLVVFGVFIAQGILAADIIFLPLGGMVFELLVKDDALLAIVLVLRVELGIALHGMNFRLDGADDVGGVGDDLG